MASEKRLLIVLGLSCLLGCEPQRPSVTSDSTPRAMKRVEAIGCWTLSRVTDKTSIVNPDPLPMFVRLDTLLATRGGVRNRRLVQRLDNRGRRLLRDAEGFSFSDEWTADSASDSIRILFNNGLYGSTWVLGLLASRGTVDTLHGRSQAFGDVVPAPEYPITVVMATRIGCAATSDSASGV